MRAIAAIVALLLLAVALVAAAPATLLDAWVRSASNDNVLLEDARGTVWSGAGALAAIDGAWRLPVDWSCDALALLRGTVHVTLHPVGEATTRGEIDAHGDTLVVAGLHADLPAAVIASAWRVRAVPRLGGDIAVDAPALRIDSGRIDGRFDAHWRHAVVGASGLALDLGEVDAHGQSAGGSMPIALSGTGGDVTVAGIVRVDADRIAVDATLTPAPGLAPALALLLRSLGPAGPGGSVHLAWQGPR